MSVTMPDVTGPELARLLHSVSSSCPTAILSTSMTVEDTSDMTDDPGWYLQLQIIARNPAGASQLADRHSLTEDHARSARRRVQVWSGWIENAEPPSSLPVHCELYAPPQGAL